MDAKTSASALQKFPEAERADLVERIANIGRVPPEMLMRIDAVLRAELSAIAAAKKRRGGRDFAASLMENLDGTQRGKLLVDIAKKDKKLADAISRQAPAKKEKKKGGKS